jgi:Zn finger protein HypA/HybF involved in hydrogenase expression
MWQCDNCGYTDEDVTAFEEDTEEGLEDTVRYCPECGSDEVFQVDDDEAEVEVSEVVEEEEEEDDDDDWESNGNGDDDW